MIPDPRQFATFEEWSAHAAEDLRAAGYTPMIVVDGEWRRWCADLAAQNLEIADPYTFEDWREWALRLLSTL